MITRQVHPPLPAECRVHGFLYEADDVRQLSEDMLDVVLPHGLLVTAGWYPDGDANGCYRICIYRDYEVLIEPITTKDVDNAAAEVCQLVATWMVSNISAATDTDETFTRYREAA